MLSFKSIFFFSKKAKTFLSFLIFLFTLSSILVSITLYSHQKSSKTISQEVGLYSNQSGNDLTLLLKQAILSAKHSIYIEIFSLTDPIILASLNMQAEKGILITIVFDQKNCPYLPAKLHSSIQQIPKKLKGIMHRKLLIIDHQDIWIGSANFTSQSLKMHGNLLMHLSSHEIAKYLLSKQKSDYQSFYINNQKVELWLPASLQAKEQILKLISNAKESLKIAMFTWTDPELTKAIIHASLQGIETEVIIDNQSSSGSSQKTVLSLKHHLHYLAKSKGSELFHYKFAYIDRSILIHGSTNWTKAAFEKNHECHLIIYDLNHDQQNFLDSLWKSLKSSSEEIFEEAA